MAGALSVAHAAGLVHRDIKPANILLSEDGRVKVGDFGIAKAAESADLTQEGSFLGTAKYLAPEQVEAKPVDGRTDLYSLGVVLYEMLCGRVPFEADTSSSTALARLHSDPPRPRLVKAGVPRELEAITMRLLARDPAAATRPPPTPGPRCSAPGPTTGPRSATRRRSAHRRRPAAPCPAPGRTLGRDRLRTARRPRRRALDAAVRHARPRFADSERRWLVPTLLVVLVAVALGVAGLLLQGPGDGLFGGDDGDNNTPRRDHAAEQTHGHHHPLGRLRPRGRRRGAPRGGRGRQRLRRRLRRRPGRASRTRRPTGVASSPASA